MLIYSRFLYIDLKLSVAKAKDLLDGVTFPDDSESSKREKEDARILVPRDIFEDFEKKGSVYNNAIFFEFSIDKAVEENSKIGNAFLLLLKIFFVGYY